jgi:hypothetical protein
MNSDIQYRTDEHARHYATVRRIVGKHCPTLADQACEELTKKIMKDFPHDEKPDKQIAFLTAAIERVLTK